jgi:regulator of protease activity HflC (stomatin/prohibitin superfamily)
MDTGLLFGFFLVIVLLFCLITLARAARIVRQYEKGLVMRLGKFHAMTPSGLTFIVPFIDDLIRVDMREQVISVPPQKLITKDNVTVEVDAVVYYKVVDPVKSQFEVQDFGYACTTLAQTNLRNLIGDRTLDETLVARDMINTNLRHVLDEATNNWGVKATRVEVQKIDPPRDITEAMSRQMKAERDKRAAVLEADGVKQSQILQAEGFKQSEILKAEGDAQARITRANAEAEAIKLVSTAAETFFKERAEMMRRLEVLNNTLAQNTKYIVPSNAGLVNVLGLDGMVQGAQAASAAPASTTSSGRSLQNDGLMKPRPRVKRVDKHGNSVRVGDRIRVTGIHSKVRDTKEFKTRTILKRCVGRVFPFTGFKRIGLSCTWAT